jgi:hypothetical protein
MTGGPVEERDDAGRTDDDPGFVFQARMFTGIGVFMFVISIVYGFISKEAAGITMLVLAGGLATLTAAYIGVHEPRADLSVDDAIEAGTAGDEEPWFPHASVWPFTVGLGAFLVGNGLLLGLWLVLPAAVVLGGAIIGFTRQSRQRS